jgi:class 3 adenylate cyclase/tetratricopeptide (TPR) repeat protein
LPQPETLRSETALMKCTNCQHENAPGQKFCGECGARLEAVCPSCQTKNPPGQKFCGECGAPLAGKPPPAEVAPARPPDRFASPDAYTPKHLAEKILTSKTAIEGERKIVTVMFSDVSGFTAMSEKLDPEDVHGIMDRAFEVILEAVHRYEGTVNQFLGDGVMALFGAPIAHEDHAQRALSAALAIQEGLKPLAAEVHRAYGIEFRMRMGLNTGPVVVGAIGRDLRMDYTAVGDTTNLAARLMAIAKPGQIVTSRRTQNLRDRFFVFEDLGEFQLKGKTEPVRAYAVQSELSGRTRLEVSKERGLTPLVGRERELRSLGAIHRRASERHGAIALLVGDPGVGKSRLLYEFLHIVEAGGVQILETTCASYGRSMAYRPIVDLLRRSLGLFEGIPAEEIRSRVVEHLRFLGVEGDDPAILLAHFLGVAAPPEFLNRLSGPQLKERTFATIRDVLLRTSEQAALVVVVENVHWIDTASDDFLANLAASLPGHRVLLVLTARPGYSSPWVSPPLAETVTVEGLGAAHVRGMVSSLLAVEEVSEDLFKFLSERSEGNPLYVEEVLRQLQETGGITIVEGEARLSRADVTVPPTIHDIIAARVDRLGDALKQTLQGAAVVGRRFGVSLVSRVLEVHRDDVAKHLEDLHGLDFVFPAAQEPELLYSFKHALTQDVVYGGVLERRRRTYHTAAGVGLEELYSGRIDDVVELVAYHFGRGQVWDKAATYLRQTAVKAQARSAHREALAALEEALQALRHLPQTAQTREQEIDVRIELRGSLYPLGDFERMLAYLKEAETMAGAISDSRRLGLVSIHTAEYHRQTGRFADARALAEQALAHGERLQDGPLRLYASHYLGLACHALGDYRRASEALKVITEAPASEWRTGAFTGSVESSWAAFQAITLAWLARSLAELGEFEESLEAGRRAVVFAEELGSPYTITAACIGLGYGSLVLGDLPAATRVLERACSVAREANLALFRPQAVRLLGAAYLFAGRIEEAVALVRTAADEVESRKLLMQQAVVLALLGETCLFAGRVDEAATAARRALSLAQERGQRGDAAAALFVLAEAAARGALDSGDAEKHYLSAIALSGELGMRPLLARAHLGVGRLYLGTGARDQAEDHLLTATREFIAMDMRLWLRQVMTTLGELGGLLIVDRERPKVYDYLSRVVGTAEAVQVVLDTPGQHPRIEDEARRRHADLMLRSHGLSVADAE